MPVSNCPSIVNLCICQGADYTHTFQYRESDLVTPVDITGWTFRGQLRNDIDDTTPMWDGSAPNFIITDASAGEFQLKILDTESEAFTEYEGVYDIEGIDPSSEVWRVVQGEFVIDREVTR